MLPAISAECDIEDQSLESLHAPVVQSPEAGV